MKILILSDIQDHGKKCAEGLQKLGNEVYYAYPKGMIAKDVNLNQGIKLIELPYGGAKSYILNSYPLRRLCKKIKPDVVHVHYATGFGLLAMLAGVHPYVISCYGSDIFEFPNKNRLNHWLLCRILKNADALQSTSIVMSTEIKTIIHDVNKKIDIIPFGINLEQFMPNTERINNKRPVIGFIKSLYPIYDIPLLLHAFKLLYEKMDEKPVLKIVGDGPLLSDLKELVKSLQLDRGVLFLGRIPNEEIPRLLNSFDVFVNSSKEESFGVNILEAMACKIPVVATNCLGPKEVMENGKNGILLKDREPETMADAILRLLKDNGMRETYINNGRRRVESCYDWNKNVMALQKSLEKVVNKNII